MLHLLYPNRKAFPVLGTILLLGLPFSAAQAHHHGFGSHFGGGLGAGLGAGVGYGVANYGMHQIFGYHHHYYGGYGPSYYTTPSYYAPNVGYGYGGPSYYAPPAPPVPQTNVTVVNEVPPPPPSPPSDVPNYPYPVPGYTHYQPGSGYTTEPRVTYVPGYGNVPVSSPITP